KLAISNLQLAITLRGGEAPLPIRAAARLPKHAPVGRFAAEASKNLKNVSTASTRWIAAVSAAKCYFKISPRGS
ncbi:MAG: hypothetical protein IKS45_10655, partial [Thermoguttaceae bacterium]|nr:hypothetical protein [Thermoguttaceae bacterium]